MKWKLALCLFALALPGVVVTAWLALPLLVDAAALPVPLPLLQVASAVQGSVFALVAALLGAALAHKVGFRAPLLAAALGQGDVRAAWREQWRPGLVGAVICTGIMLGFQALAPAPLAALQQGDALPLVVRLLYGGITEEVLIRWGLMTLLAWAGWRLLQRGEGAPAAAIVWLAIGISALLFGVAHVPAVAALLTDVPATVVAYVTLGNALFGVVAGYLFWRHGLEAAILAHLLAHVLAYAVTG